MSAATDTTTIAVGDIVSWEDQRDPRAQLRYEVKEIRTHYHSASIREVGTTGPIHTIPLRWLIRVGGPREAMTG